MQKSHYAMSVFENHPFGKENNGQKLWSILVFLLWQKNYFE